MNYIMNYMIRDENGISLMKVDNHTAQMIICQTKGHFRHYRSVNQPLETKLIFEILEAAVWTCRPGAEIYLHSGTKLIPE